MLVEGVHDIIVGFVTIKISRCLVPATSVTNDGVLCESFGNCRVLLDLPHVALVLHVYDYLVLVSTRRCCLRNAHCGFHITVVLNEGKLR